MRLKCPSYIGKISSKSNYIQGSKSRIMYTEHMYAKLGKSSCFNAARYLHGNFFLTEYGEMNAGSSLLN